PFHTSSSKQPDSIRALAIRPWGVNKYQLYRTRLFHVHIFLRLLLQCVPPNIQHHALNIVSFYLPSVVYRFEFVRQSHVMADESSQCRPSLGRIPVAQKDRSFHPAILLSSWIYHVQWLLLRESHILIISFLFVYQHT